MNIEGARQRAENLRVPVKNLDLQFSGQSLGVITASLRVALFRIMLRVAKL